MGKMLFDPMQVYPGLPDRAFLPTHKDLPETDGSIVENFQKHPQSALLRSSIRPGLYKLHPDGRYALGADSGIYWRRTDPPLIGCIAPDWFYVPNVPPMLDGEFRGSYVLWQEEVRPTQVIEYVRNDATAERNRTPNTGKFWVYERGIEALYYAIFIFDVGELEVYRLSGQPRRYRRVRANRQGLVELPELVVHLGAWHGTFQGHNANWLRLYDGNGVLLPAARSKSRSRASAPSLRKRPLNALPPSCEPQESTPTCR